MKNSLKQLGQTNMSHDKEKQNLLNHIKELSIVVEQQKEDIEEYNVRKSQLQSEIFYLKS